MTERKIAEAFPPGDFLKEELEARNWSQVELAEIIGRQPYVVNELIMGKRPITPEIAKALGEAFSTSAQYWMNLESSYQLWRTRDSDNVISRRAKLYQLAPIKEMVKRHWLEPSENIEVLESRVRHFLEINSLDESPQLAHAARKGIQEISPAQTAWLFRAKQLARGVHTKVFSDQSFDDGVVRLKQLLHNAQEIRHVPKVLGESGIRFLVVEQLPQTKIDGVTLWLDNKSPVIVLSLRFDRIDWFWYTLAHELGHVKNRDGQKDIMLDMDLVGENAQKTEDKSEAEKNADWFATAFLIEQSSLDNFIMRVGPLYAKQQILGFANRIGVHPGIVVGQLQFRKEIPWSSYRQALEKVRHIIIQSSLTDGWGHMPPIFKNEEVENAHVQ
jgi:HTH-type transcriptional regulator/antitoxin HigA